MWHARSGRASDGVPHPHMGSLEPSSLSMHTRSGMGSKSCSTSWNKNRLPKQFKAIYVYMLKYAVEITI